jgi:nucleotide-binding universal stress UspA family protein
VILLLFKSILVPIDGSPTSLRALDLAVEFSMRDGSKLALLYVIFRPPMYNTHVALEEMRKYGESVLDMAESNCRSYGLAAKKLLKVADTNRSSPAYEIVKEAINGRYDCVILGSRGYAGELGILLGSVAISVAISVPCTTIIVR